MSVYLSICYVTFWIAWTHFDDIFAGRYLMYLCLDVRVIYGLIIKSLYMVTTLSYSLHYRFTLTCFC